MRTGVVVLPEWPHEQAAAIWSLIEELGFDHAWTYDHLSWRDLGQKPWYGTVPVLAGAALATSRIRLGTLVASPNFRHPAPFSREIMTLDEISGGRFTAGLGSGAGRGADSRILGGQPWRLAERTERFAEFVEMLDRLLTSPVTTHAGRYYQVAGMPNIPGCVQQPRVPFAIAGASDSAMRLAARYGSAWVTPGEPARAKTRDLAARVAAVHDQVRRLAEACSAQGRDPAELDKILLAEPAGERPLDQPEAFGDLARAYADAGITDLVLHYPRDSEPFAGTVAALERLAGARI
jgi:alkanesulfonate monooxygenase SsuD/methylene tetrahydromethanopterin reductase-like flavin-dependent oxidoreductase (luciferase family)